MSKANILSLIIFTGFTLIGYTFLDPDFPWHVRFGGEIIRNGLEYRDQYSYTMPSFRFVDHAWIMSVLFSLVHDNLQLGYLGVSMTCALFATAAARLAGNGFLWLTPLVAASYLDGGGVRTHVVTFLFLAVLIKMIQGKYLRQWIYALPFFMLLWANMHGGFIIGLVYIWGYFVVEVLVLQRKKTATEWRDTFHLLCVFVLSTAFTFVTPYFVGTWEEALRTVNNPILEKNISEWQPMYRLISFSLLPMFVLFAVSVWYSRKISWLKIFTGLLLVQSIQSIRMAPLFCVAAAFVIAEAFVQFRHDKRFTINNERLLKVLGLFTLISLCIFLFETSINVRNRQMVNHDAYPLAATEFLKENPPQGNMFSIIHWTNYVIWKIPNIKSFADGRMMVWEQKSIPHELDNAFQTYMDLTKQRIPFEPLANEFCITTVLWNTFSEDSSWMSRASWIDITQTLNKNEWTKTYEDTIAVIYSRPLPQTCTRSL